MNKLIILAAIFLIVLVTGCSLNTKEENSHLNISQDGLNTTNDQIPENNTDNIEDSPVAGKLRQCPDEWINNQMPCACINDSCDNCNKERQYFIMNGERRELSEFDVEWIKENCDVTPISVV